MHAPSSQGRGGGAGREEEERGKEIEQVPSSYPGRGVRMLRSEPVTPGQGVTQNIPRTNSSSAASAAWGGGEREGDGVPLGRDVEGERRRGGGGRDMAGEQKNGGKVHGVAQREYETWEELGRRQRRIDHRGFDMEGMLQVCINCVTCE